MEVIKIIQAREGEQMRVKEYNEFKVENLLFF